MSRNNVLVDAIFNAGKAYVTRVLEGGDCACLACQTSRLVDGVAAHAAQVRQNPTHYAGKVATGLAQAAEQAAAGRRDRGSRELAEAIKTVRHGVDSMRQRRRPSE